MGIFDFKILSKDIIRRDMAGFIREKIKDYFNQDNFLNEFLENNLKLIDKTTMSYINFFNKNEAEISLFDFYKIAYDQTKNYVSFELDIKNKKINITFNSPNNEKYYLKDNINDIYNLKIDDFYKQAINKLNIYDENNNFKGSWYLLKNNKIINNKKLENLNKILNIWNKISEEIKLTFEKEKITLELIKNFPIGTKLEWGDSYKLKESNNLWEFYMKEENNYRDTGISETDKEILKDLKIQPKNQFLFSVPNNENNWNEIAKYSIFNWNEFLELEKFITEPQTELKNLDDVKKYIENIKNKKDIENRILPIINKTAKLDKKINIFDYAKQELEQSKYSHSIEFDINKNTNILDLNKIKLGDKFILYFNNKEYETILSAIQFENNKNTIHLVFGKARINFIDMLKTKNI